MFIGPLRTKNIGKLFEVFDRSDSYGVNAIVEPFETYGDKFVSEKLLIELSGQSWELLNHWQLDTPILVFTKTLERRNNRLL